jgi:transposase
MSRYPWEQQKDEGNKAYQAFSVYRDMGANRSTSKVAQHFGKSKTLMDKWCGRWNWVERVMAFTLHNERLEREAAENARIDMVKRHTQIALMVQQKVVEKLRGMTTKQVEQMSPSDLVKMIDVSVKVERLSRGESTENKQVTGADGGPIAVEDVGVLTTEERRARINELIAEQRRRAAGVDGAGRD